MRVREVARLRVSEVEILIVASLLKGAVTFNCLIFDTAAELNGVKNIT